VLGTSFAAMSLPAVVATISYYRLGIMNVRLLTPLVGGAILGAAGGAQIAAAIPDEILRWSFACIFFALGMRFLRGPLAPRLRKRTVSADKS
jgi:uncharacterized membrane protein YfcA